MTDKSNETPQALFVRVLQVDLELATMLVTNGFTTLEEVAYVPIDEMKAIDGLDEQQIQTWRARARRYLLVQIPEDRDEGDSLAAAAVRPRKPNSGGSGASTE